MEFTDYLFNEKFDASKLTKTQSLFKDGVYEFGEIGENAFLVDLVEPTELTYSDLEVLPNGEIFNHYDTDLELAQAILKDDDSDDSEIELAEAILELESENSQEQLIWTP